MGVFLLFSSGIIVIQDQHSFISRPLHISRNFFGVLRIVEEKTKEEGVYHRILYHGSTLHGTQFTGGEFKDYPTSYYDPESGVGRVFAYFGEEKPLRVGVAGLGAGTIATFGDENDYFRFYEIDQRVVDINNQYFTYLKDMPGTVDVAVGDARLLMEREDIQNFDIIVLDAFSSDSVPIHLLTKESLEVYLKHLSEDGAIVYNISNRYLDLEPIIANLAKDLNLRSRQVISNPEYPNSKNKFIVVTKNEEMLSSDQFKDMPPARTDDKMGLWTDNYSNLLDAVM